MDTSSLIAVVVNPTLDRDCVDGDYLALRTHIHVQGDVALHIPVHAVRLLHAVHSSHELDVHMSRRINILRESPVVIHTCLVQR